MTFNPFQLPEMKGNPRGKHSRWGERIAAKQDMPGRLRKGRLRRLKRLSRVQRNATVNIGNEGRPSDWGAVCGESRLHGSAGAVGKVA